MRALHISRVDLNLFVVFETIYSEGGITRAAEKLHLSQPAISHALSRLREMFGDPLFVRQGQSMNPTPLARNLVEPVRQALRTLEGTLNESGPFDPVASHRRFVLGLRAELEAVLLPALVARVSATAPSVELAAVRIDRRRVEADLASGLLDAAIDVLLPGSGALRQTRLGTDSLVVVVRQNHPGAGTAPDLETYLEWNHVLVSSRRRGASLEDVALQKRGAQRHVALRCQQYFAAFRVVAETGFALTLPASQAAVMNSAFGHAIVPFPAPDAGLDRYLYWHEAADSSAANAWLRQLVTDVATPAFEPR